MKTPTVHELKIIPFYFELQLSGAKRFEVRCNDRNYQVGDILNLNEWDGENYTGRSMTVEVTCMFTPKEFDAIVEPFVLLGTSEELEAVL
ncbi:DUF3850 domain-containing protein [Vibrio cholerae]|uniref:DUF3850 domain-containing protein n=1 Tax=Vibrio cholerae TaxID=666 RepID=UPI00115A408E|nr:DUF3850 domain-containing protein [Vibrio cholerae]TQP97153.1 DUF3850 domain-containing protein [Vibrio cholerae]